MSDQVRAVMVGCGGITRGWLTAINNMPNVQMVGMVDLYEDAARSRAEEFGLSEALIGTDMGAVIDQTQPDAVFNCTTPNAHYDVTMQALAKGCHVLSEKPLADTMDHARAMVAAAEEAGKIFAVIQNRRYDPNIRRVRHALDTELVGSLTTLNSDFYIGAHFGGFRDRMEHVLLLDMAIHSFDQARLITGADPVSVWCKEWNPRGSWYDHDASAIAIFQMTNDIVYTYRGSWCAEGLNTSWDCDWRLLCDKGSITWDGADGIIAEVPGTRERLIADFEPVDVPIIDPGTKVGRHAGVIAEFVSCVQSGATPETIASDNIKSLAMVLGAVESAGTGRVVEISI